MAGYSEECLNTFLDLQEKLFDSPVAETLDEAEGFLEDCMADVVDTIDDVRDYLEDMGMDTHGMTDEELEIVIAQTGEDRSIFGLDFPYSKPEHIKSDIARIRSLDISEECKEKILGKTLEKVLK